MVQEHQESYGSEWAAIESISEKIGCTAETLRRWIRRSQRGGRGSDPKQEKVSDSERIRELERENRELRRANEILRTASAFFAQAELDRQLK